jgi:hypothetical protein
MARIKTYPIDTLVTDKDIIIGSDADVFNQTKNFKAETLRNYMLSGLEPEVGGNLKITTITATDEINLTPEAYFNNLEEPLVVLNYEIIFLILNGRTYIFRQNGNTYGIDETQTTSEDFTEIDITSVINANLQDLDSVLLQGNYSNSSANILSLFLKNTHLPSGGGTVNINGDKNRFNIVDNQDLLVSSIGQNKIIFPNAGTSRAMSILVPNVTSDRIATFQNASGTIAYLSDIDDAIEEISVGALDIESSDETVLVTSNDGVYDLSVGYRAYVTDTQLRDSLTNTVFYQQGGLFNYDSVEIPINSVRFQFNTNIGSSLESGNFGIVYFLYEDGSVNYYLLQFSDVVVSGNTLTAVFPLEEYWSDVVGQRLSVIDLTLYPKCVKAIGGNLFEGPISGAISKYIYKWE